MQDERISWDVCFACLSECLLCSLGIGGMFSLLACLTVYFARLFGNFERSLVTSYLFIPLLYFACKRLTHSACVGVIDLVASDHPVC